MTPALVLERSPRASASAAEATGWSAGEPVDEYPTELIEALGEQWLLGDQRADDRAAAGWREVHRRGSALGFHRLLRPLGRQRWLVSGLTLGAVKG